MDRHSPQRRSPRGLPALIGLTAFRRPLPWSSGVLLAVALLAASAGCRRDRALAPNSVDVVLVTIDTWRYDSAGFDGNTRGTTPNLDALAADARVFTFAHAHVPLTLPSHTDILTGLYPAQHGVRDNSGFRLEKTVPTLATILRNRGYATGAFIGAYPLDSRYGLAHGFDVYDERYRRTEAPQDFSVPERPASEVVAAARGWFDSQTGKRRFLWIHLFDPHAPYAPPPPFDQRFADDLYLGEVASTDAALGPLITALRQTNAPPTLLVVTGDHGEARGDHGELTHGLFAYESTLHVPLLLWCPPLVTPGKDNALARHVDILPTILQAVGAPIPAALPGRSFLAADRTPAESSYLEAVSATLNRGWAPLHGIIQGNSKYIDLPLPELYDLAQDPGETRNLVSQRTDLVRKIKLVLDGFPLRLGGRGAVSSEEAAKMRSLGYLTGSGGVQKSYGPEEDPKNLIETDRQLHQIVDLFQRGRMEAATALARNVVAEKPKMQMGYEQLAFLLQQQGDLVGTLRVLDAAERQGAADESLAVRRALLLDEVGREEEALRALEPYRDSQQIDTLNALGISLADSGRLEDALGTFRRALEIDPRNGEAYQNIGIALLKADRVDEAAQNLERALSLNDRNPRALNALGVARMRQGSVDGALEAWDRAAAEDPTQYDALFNIGLVAFRTGRRQQAREALERFVTTAPPSRYGKDIASARAALRSLAGKP
jgi:arylsulfatase A-like enzyme/Flp pilus assembly protein TadD